MSDLEKMVRNLHSKQQSLQRRLEKVFTTIQPYADIMLKYSGERTDDVNIHIADYQLTSDGIQYSYVWNGRRGKQDQWTLTLPYMALSMSLADWTAECRATEIYRKEIDQENEEKFEFAEYQRLSAKFGNNA